MVSLSKHSADTQEAIQHWQRLSETLSNRSAQQQNITIPATDTHGPRNVPIDKPEAKTPPTPDDLTINAQPADTPEQKAEELTKPVEDNTQSRQQNLLNSIKALKIAIAEVAKDMYSTEMLDGSVDKAVSKCIETISSEMANQTAETVKSLASPLIGAQ